MARDGVPRRHGVLPVPVETGAGVEYEKWNWPRALQEVSEEWEVRDLCITRGSGPRVVWLLEGAYQHYFLGSSPIRRSSMPNPTCKTTVSIRGSSAENIIFPGS
jgi:hypothetical protein